LFNQYLKTNTVVAMISAWTVESCTAKLALEDGSVFVGQSFGARGSTTGEVVFNTSMTGYQEILTDPSYCGQIVTMTYPEIGNYGVNDEDVESRRPYLSGFVVRNLSPIASNFRSSGTLDQYLRRHNVVGISNVDTRALVRHIRDQGAMKCVISTENLDNDPLLVQQARDSEGLVGQDLVRRVLPDQPINWQSQLSRWWDMRCVPNDRISINTDGRHLVALDYGLKWNIARHLYNQGFRVTILPGTATAEEVMACQPDGVFLSNGPGDPEPLIYAIETIRSLLGHIPVFGICLGHQLFALACGAKTFKLKFGHHGANQPVLNQETGRIEITAQNHGFAVSDEDLPSQLIVTHRNLNDNTIAGLKHRDYPAFSVQYHPEASAGPHDSQYLFTSFRRMIEQTPV
jgi:carbamoyl-phosphate synthase small subunit